MIRYPIITHFARAGTLYEDAKYHNAVFVGTDEHGVARHAQKRSTNSQGKSFKLNVAGSDARYSFHHPGTDGDLYVFEAPIDLLSYTLPPDLRSPCEAEMFFLPTPGMYDGQMNER